LQFYTEEANVATFPFDREVHVPGAPGATWATFTDVPRVVSWISVVEDAQELEPLSRYTAVLQDKIGMFALRADLDITLSDVVEGRQLRAHADGQDRQVGARIVIDGLIELTPADSGTQVRVSGSYDVTGRAATLGASSIRRKGDKVIEEFFRNLSQELAAR
jgi:carbon monoxide dehydrogenase subunit G